MDEDNLRIQRIQLHKYAVNLLHLKRDLPDVADKKAELLLDNSVDRINNFIDDPENSYVNLSWVTTIIDFYSHVSCFQVSDSFFQRIELAKLVKLYRTTNLSYLVVFIKGFIDFLNRCEKNERDTEKRKKIIRDVFLEIDLCRYVDSVNGNLHERWNIASKGGSTTVNNETLSSVISNIGRCYSRASNLIKDDDIRLEIRSKVGNFYNKIDFSLLGKLLEIQKKELGPVTGMIREMNKSGCNKALIEKMLGEIDFQRLANAYNDKPVSSTTQIGTFCKVYFHTRSLHKKWNEFFVTLDFSKCFIKKSFNFLDTIFVLGILNEVFKKDDPSLSKVLSGFDFKKVGITARGRDNRRMNELFRFLLSANLTKRQYFQFIDGFGVTECNRFASDRYIMIIFRRYDY